MRPILHALVLILLIPSTLMAEPKEIFRDLSLQHGFNLSAVRSSMVPLEIGVILSENSELGPYWRLAQWGTRFDLKSAKTQYQPDTTRFMTNPGKTLNINPGGLAGEGVQLAVQGGAEYDGQLRQQGEPWPHILIEQHMPKDFMVSDYSKLDFHLEFRVDQCENATELTLNRGLHTAQITAFFAIRNTNKDSQDFNDSIWFGLPLFDARFDTHPGHQAVDGGKNDATGKFICTLKGNRFYDSPTGDGTWKTLDADLVPLVREALAAAQAKGFLTHTTFQDLHPTSFNLGWEVTGPYNCAITLKKLSLQGTPAAL